MNLISPSPVTSMDNITHNVMYTRIFNRSNIRSSIILCINMKHHQFDPPMLFGARVACGYRLILTWWMMLMLLLMLPLFRVPQDQSAAIYDVGADVVGIVTILISLITIIDNIRSNVLNSSRINLSHTKNSSISCINSIYQSILIYVGLLTITCTLVEDCLLGCAGRGTRDVKDVRDVRDVGRGTRDGGVKDVRDTGDAGRWTRDARDVGRGTWDVGRGRERRQGVDTGRGAHVNIDVVHIA